MTRQPNGVLRRPRRTMGRSRPRNPVFLVGLALLTLFSLVGCGIRPTSVPVDAGAAPTRMSCAAPAPSPVRSPEVGSVAGKVYLVCSGRVLAVERTVTMPRDSDPLDPLDVARVLLEQLRSAPLGPEVEAGFSTDIPADLTVSGARPSDPDAVLRLSQQPDELPAFALAQIVCTYAPTVAAGTNRSVLLGGPADSLDRPPLRYECGSALRSDPEAARTAGVPL